MESMFGYIFHHNIHKDSYFRFITIFFRPFVKLECVIFFEMLKSPPDSKQSPFIFLESYQHETLIHGAYLLLVSIKINYLKESCLIS